MYRIDTTRPLCKMGIDLPWFYSNLKCCSPVWVAVKELNLSYHSPETYYLLYGNLN